jgi:hypothetical protein
LAGTVSKAGNASFMMSAVEVGGRLDRLSGRDEEVDELAL